MAVLAGGISGGDCALLIERRLERAKFCFVETSRFFIFADERGFFACGNRDGNDFVGKDTVGDGFTSPLVAADSEVVLLSAGELVFCGALIAVGAHVLVVVGVAEAVVNHGIDEHSVAKTIAGASLWQQVRGQTHVFHTAGDDDIGLVQLDRLAGKHDGLESGATNFIDGRGADAGGQACLEGSLASRILAQTCADHIAHDDFGDLIGGHSCAVQSGLDTNRAELRRWDGG